MLNRSGYVLASAALNARSEAKLYVPLPLLLFGLLIQAYENLAPNLVSWRPSLSGMNQENVSSSA